MRLETDDVTVLNDSTSFHFFNNHGLPTSCVIPTCPNNGARTLNIDMLPSVRSQIHNIARTHDYTVGLLDDDCLPRPFVTPACPYVLICNIDMGAAS
jgi:hypothetical protein